MRGNITFERIDVMHLPELPKGWVWVRLGNILGFIKGKKPSDLGHKTELRTIPYINIKSFEEKVFEQFTDGKDCPLCNYDDILIVWDGARCGLVGKGVQGAIGSTLAKLECKFNELNKLFIFYFLQSKYDYINKRPRGVGIPHIEPNIFWNIPIPLPPLAEQKRIVEKIEELFTRLEAGGEALKKVKAQIRRYRQAVLKYAFEGKLTEEWRKHAGADLCVCPENIKKGKHIGSPIQDDLSPLPEGWVWVRLGEVAEINPRFIGNNLPEDIEVTFLPMKCVEELTGHIDLSNTKKLSDVKEGYTPFIEGDVLFAKITPCMENGKVAIAHNLKNSIGFGSTEFHVIRPQAPLYNRFLFFFLLQEGLRKDAQRNMTGSAGQLRVPVSYMQQIPLPLPPLPEQRQIVSEIERRFSVSDEVEKVVDQSLKQAERLKQSILKKAFEGKLVPQNPNDEPAERLLERIRLKEDKNIKDHKVSAII